MGARGEGTPDVSGLWRDERERFAALRRSDAHRSLVDRWAWLQANRPEIAAADFEYMPALLEHTWIVMAVPEDRVIYTIGLHYHYAQPELLLTAPELAEGAEPLVRLKGVLNELGQRVRDGLRIQAGDRVEAAGKSATFHAYLDEHFDPYPSGHLGGFEELFNDVVHDAGGTMPIIWADLSRKAKPKAAGTRR